MNSVLMRATGYRLTRETPEQRQQAIREAAKRARSRAAEKYQRRLATERAAWLTEPDAQPGVAGQTRKAARLPLHFDAGMRRIVRRVHPRTMTGYHKLQALIEATRYVVRDQIPGEIVECGVWRGGSMQAVALTLLEQGDTTRELHLFDTFEGMPPPTELDSRTRIRRTTSAEDLLGAAPKGGKLWAVAGLDDVQQGMSEIDYPADKVHFHPGLVEDTTPQQAPQRIALLRLDTDWYASTLHELEVLYERLSPGGVLIIDDYDDWDGARKATDEWLAKLGHPLFLAPMAGGRIAMKPVEQPHDQN